MEAFLNGKIGEDVLIGNLENLKHLRPDSGMQSTVASLLCRRQIDIKELKPDIGSADKRVQRQMHWAVIDGKLNRDEAGRLLQGIKKLSGPGEYLGGAQASMAYALWATDIDKNAILSSN